MQTVLIRVTGIDQPGITNGILHILAESGARVHDMEQVVVRDRLNLGLLIDIDEAHPPLKDLLFFGWQRDMHIDFEMVAPHDAAPVPIRFAVTVIGSELTPTALGGVTDAIVAAGGNINRITRLSTYPVVSYEMLVEGGAMDDLRTQLLHASSAHRVDVAVQPEGLSRRAKRLVVIDMDSTLVQDEVIDLLAEEAGVGDRVRALTDAAMHGEIDFEDALRERVSLLAGLPADRLPAISDKIRLTPGARTFARTLRRLGYRTAIVSGGFSFFADRVRTDLEMDYAFANELEVIDGALSGRVAGRIIDGTAKADVLASVAARERVPIEQTVAVGDGSNDLEMLSRAGLGIAFNAKPVVDAAADTTLKVPYLDAILFVLGIRRDEIEAADRAERD